MKFASTNPLYWAVGGVLVSYGLLKPTLRGRLVTAAGVLILAVKVAEGLSGIVHLSPGK